MINNIKIFGKFLDQPLLVAKLNKAIPKVMLTGATGIIAKDIYKNSKQNNNKQETNKEILKKSIILLTTLTSAYLSPKIAEKVTKRNGIKNVQKIIEENTKLIDSFVRSQKTSKKESKILNKAKDNILSYREIRFLITKSKDENKKEFLNKLIPNPENIEAKDIFSEIGYLSIQGAIPVLGGVLGGITGDICTNNNYKENMPNRISEGLYQYLANIFMCNIGAGCALGILEKTNIKSKLARAISMTTGIILTGVLGGSKIANLISNKIMAPLVSPNQKTKERTPEALDLCLHVDDIATVSMLSGLKWIEPALPILYSISGYKAGIGYRN